MTFSKSILKSLQSVSIALLALLAGVLMRKYLFGALEGRIVYVTFYPAVVVASVFGGWFCGLLTAVGSALVAVYAWPFFVNKPFIADSGDWLGLYAFMFNCLLISAVAQMMRLARARALEAKEQAEKANHAKSVFLANMSHELRTPMNAVLGFSQLLQRDPSLSPQARGQVNTIMKSGAHLLEIINDVLEMSRIEAGRPELRYEQRHLPELLEDMAVMFRQRAEEKRLTLTLDCAPELPQYVVTDVGKLRQILVNLLGNAVKFTKEGTILLKALPLAADRIAIMVQDTGIGIAPEEQEMLFRPFERTRSGQQTAGGTGLGLAISRDYAHLMGGEITVESRPGEGSCFRLEFHAQTTNPSPDSSKTKHRVTGLALGQTEVRVLVVDDQPTNRELLRGILEPVGFTVDEACDGATAIEKASSRVPHIVLMDLIMPGMNGIEATRIIRQTCPRGTTMVIGISASAFEKEKRAFIEAGLDAFIAKPFREQELFDVLARHTGVVFETAAIQDQALGPSTNPNKPTLLKMPAEWCKAFQEALVLGNIAGIRHLGKVANQFDPAVSVFILEHAARYDLGKLRQLNATGQQGSNDE